MSLRAPTWGEINTASLTWEEINQLVEVDPRALLQAVLDNALAESGVYSYWQRKAETAGEDPDEYIVYTLGGDSVAVYADDMPYIKAASATVRYYYRDSLLDTYEGREKIKVHEKNIATALEQGGFSLPNGWFDVGDIDDIGFGATVFEAYYGRVV